MSALTDPERITDRTIGRRIMGKILKDPCRYCVNRGETYWDRTFCKVDGRTYFDCKIGRSKPEFELDEKAIGELSNA